MKFTVYLVMTVTMNRRKIDGLVMPAIAIKVMACNQILRFEEESTGLTASVLLLS